MSDFRRGYELCCEDCDHMARRWQPLDSYNASAPEDAYCDADHCMADAEVLRELEAAITLSAEYITGRLRYVSRRQDSFEYLLDCISPSLDRDFEDAFVAEKVIHRELRMATEAIMRHRRVAA
jgi:hypothetical protein